LTGFNGKEEEGGGRRGRRRKGEENWRKPYKQPQQRAFNIYETETRNCGRVNHLCFDTSVAINTATTVLTTHLHTEAAINLAAAPFTTATSMLQSSTHFH